MWRRGDYTGGMAEPVWVTEWKAFPASVHVGLRVLMVLLIAAALIWLENPPWLRTVLIVSLVFGLLPLIHRVLRLC